MLLSDWYAQWKEKRIQAAVEEASAKAYDEGYAAGKSEDPDLTGRTVTRGKTTGVVTRGRSKGEVLRTTGKGK